MNFLSCRMILATFLASCVAGTMSVSAQVVERPNIAPVPAVSDDGAVEVPSFELPFSSLASEAARQSFIKRLNEPMSIVADIEATRRITDEKLLPQLARSSELYPYTADRTEMGGVPVDIYIPEAGVAAENEHRVLIHLHGGGFVAGGGGVGGAVESVPIAGEGGFKVVSVDYRLAPEHHFPAASEDVQAVYQELLKTYRPENIGIYGCSAGGMLTGQAVARFQSEGLPLPGAVGIFCASTHTFEEGDSAQLWPRLGSVLRILPSRTSSETFGPGLPYLAGVSVNDPLAVPSASDEVMSKFPPTLFLTGTRSSEMSGAAHSHLQLRELGVTSELLLFDGLDHGFFSDPALPESVRAYRFIVRFFDEHLGANPR